MAALLLCHLLLLCTSLYAVTPGCHALAALGLSDPAREVAIELGHLHQTIQSQTNKALREFLLESYRKKLSALHARISDEGSPIDKAELDRAIQSITEAHSGEQKAETTLELPATPSLDEERLGNFQNRHQENTERGWEALQGVRPLTLSVSDKKLVDGDLRHAAAALSDGSFLIASSSGTLYHFKVEASGHLVLLGEEKAPSPLTTTPVIVGGKYAIVGAKDGHVYNFEVNESGKVNIADRLKLDTFPGAWPLASVTATSRDTFVVPTGDDKIQVIKVETNGQLTELGSAETEGKVTASPLALPLRGFVVGTEDGILYHFDIDERGAIRETAKVQLEKGLGSIYAAPFALPDGSFVMGTISRTLYHFNVDELGHFVALGKLEWAAPFQHAHFAALPNGDVIATTSYGQVYHFRIPAVGPPVLVDSIRPNQKALMRSPAILPNGDVVVGSNEEFLYHLMVGADGKFVELETIERKEKSGTAATVLQNGYVVVGSNDKSVYLLKLAPLEQKPSPKRKR